MNDARIASDSEYSQDELVQIGELRKKLDTIPSLHTRREQLYKIEPKPKSQMAVDNAATNPTELGHMVTYCQNMAIDNLRSLRLLLNPSEEAGIFLPQVAMYPMIRTTIESSAQSLWLLQPGDSLERIKRTLRARKSEVAFEFDLAQMMHGEDAEDSDNEKNERRRLGSARRRHGDPGSKTCVPSQVEKASRTVTLTRGCRAMAQSLRKLQPPRPSHRGSRGPSGRW